jgi:hypothetical protein
LLIVLSAVAAAGIVAGTLIVALGGGNSSTAGGFAVTATIDKALVGSVACWTANSCVAVGAVGDEGAVWFLSRGRVTSSQALPGTVRLVSVACADGAQCVAGGQGAGQAASSAPSAGVLVAIDAGGVGTPDLVHSVQVVTGVACWSATSCVAVADASKSSAVVLLSSALVSSVRPVPAGDGTFESISCGAPGRCEIASFLNPTSKASSGLLVPLDDGVTGTPQRVGNNFGTWDIACPTATHCLAVGLIRTNGPSGYEGTMSTVTSGRPGPVVAVPGTSDLFSVSCAEDRCEAVGTKAQDKGGVGTAIVAGSAGKVMEASGTTYFSGVSCPTADACVAVGHAGANSVVAEIAP